MCLEELKKMKKDRVVLSIKSSSYTLIEGRISTKAAKNSSTSSCVLYKPNESRTIPETPKWRMTGWAQRWPVRTAMRCKSRYMAKSSGWTRSNKKLTIAPLFFGYPIHRTPSISPNFFSVKSTSCISWTAISSALQACK